VGFSGLSFIVPSCFGGISNSREARQFATALQRFS
jgi:hypothetical protein